MAIGLQLFSLHNTDSDGTSTTIIKYLSVDLNLAGHHFCDIGLPVTCVLGPIIYISSVPKLLTRRPYPQFNQSGQCPTHRTAARPIPEGRRSFVYSQCKLFWDDFISIIISIQQLSVF